MGDIGEKAWGGGVGGGLPWGQTIPWHFNYFSYTLLQGISMQMILKGHTAKSDIHSIPNGVYKQEKASVHTQTGLSVHYYNLAVRGFASRMN